MTPHFFEKFKPDSPKDAPPSVNHAWAAKKKGGPKTALSLFR